MSTIKKLLLGMLLVVMCFGYFLIRKPMHIVEMPANYNFQKSVEIMQQSKKDYGKSFEIHDYYDEGVVYMFDISHPTGQMHIKLFKKSIQIQCIFEAHMMYTNHEWIEGNEVYTRAINNLEIGNDIHEALKDIKVEGTNFKYETDNLLYTITGDENHTYTFEYTIER